MRKNVKTLLCMGLALCLSIGGAMAAFADPLLYTEPDDMGMGESINYCDYGYYDTILISENTQIYVTDDSGATIMRINPVHESYIDNIRMWWPDKINEFPFENEKRYNVSDFADGSELVVVEIGDEENYTSTFWNLRIVKGQTAGTATGSGASDKGTWANDSKGWWIQYTDGSYLKDQWYQSPDSGLWYYMGADGYMLTDTTTPDGYTINSEGVWVQ
ncbi:MAG: hypothetical protein HFG54_03590 [Lachnospiraceae bacterium]|jgi:hypothetical protein|nr:hypothetical protein [Lachnospiraceae bacterium]